MIQNVIKMKERMKERKYRNKWLKTLKIYDLENKCYVKRIISVRNNEKKWRNLTHDIVSKKENIKWIH